MLEIRPVCENCNHPLPPDALDARICSYECTFCARCVDEVLHNICPNCTGGFVPRPIRPKAQLLKHPSSTKPFHRPVDLKIHAERIAKWASIPPQER